MSNTTQYLETQEQSGQLMSVEGSQPGSHQTVINIIQQVNAPAPSWSPGVAAVLSLFIPGLGQMYKGQILNGVVWFIAVLTGYAFVVPGLALHLCCVLGAASGKK